MIATREESGNEFELFTNLVSRWAEQAGDFFVVFFLVNPLVLTTNPDAVKFLGQDLVTILDYETWIPRRKLYDPSFKRTSLKDYLPVFNECIDTFLERLRPHSDGKTEVSMKEAFHEATLDVISKVAFSSDFSKTWDSKRFGLKYTTNSELSHLTSVSFKGVEKSFMATFPSLFPLLHPKETEMYHEAVGAMRRIGCDCIEKRIKAVTSGEEVPNDILTQILQTSSQETTANTLSFAIILIQQHPEVLDSLLSEIADVIGDRKEVTADDVDKLKYTEQKKHGSERLKNMVTCTKLGPSHRPGPFIYFPFSVGHRSCIGRHFAMIEAKVILANLQSDTASFIQAGGGTVEYPTTKGQYCLHSSGNCSLKQ
ncbi:hypothetical protein EMCRGX_G028258 [Ephydatia muelleri]